MQVHAGCISIGCYIGEGLEERGLHRRRTQSGSVCYLQVDAVPVVDLQPHELGLGLLDQEVEGLVP